MILTYTNQFHLHLFSATSLLHALSLSQLSLMECTIFTIIIPSSLSLQITIFHHTNMLLIINNLCPTVSIFITLLLLNMEVSLFTALFVLLKIQKWNLQLALLQMLVSTFVHTFVSGLRNKREDFYANSNHDGDGFNFQLRNIYPLLDYLYVVTIYNLNH